MSDAGTPVFSDPGYVVVSRAVEAGIAVSPVPGPSSVLAVLSASGLAVDRFTYAGFLPRRSAARQTEIRRLTERGDAFVVHEAPRPRRGPARRCRGRVPELEGVHRARGHEGVRGVPARNRDRALRRCGRGCRRRPRRVHDRRRASRRITGARRRARCRVRRAARSLRARAPRAGCHDEDDRQGALGELPGVSHKQAYRACSPSPSAGDADPGRRQGPHVAS